MLPSRPTYPYDGGGILPSRATMAYDGGGTLASRSTFPYHRGEILSSRATVLYDGGGTLSSRPTLISAPVTILSSRATALYDGAGILSSRSTLSYDAAAVPIARPLSPPTTFPLGLETAGASPKEASTTPTTITFAYSGSGQSEPLWRESKLGDVLLAFDKLLADPRTRGRDFWRLLMGVDHKPCALLWEWTALAVLAAGDLPQAWWNEIVSSARLGLGVLLRSRRDLRGWLLSIRDHFESWLRAAIQHRCQEAVRGRRWEELEMRPAGKLARSGNKRDRSNFRVLLLFWAP
ncbi:MAG: hypothetical protein WD278_00145, partial [Pirellulales bacterium]